MLRAATTIDLQANGVGFTTRHERPNEYGVVKKRRRIDVSSTTMRREPGRCLALSDWIKSPGDKKSDSSAGEQTTLDHAFASERSSMFRRIEESE